MMQPWYQNTVGENAVIIFRDTLDYYDNSS